MRKTVIISFIILILWTMSMFPIKALTQHMTDTEKVPSRMAYLTFDDGPSKLTKQILDILKDFNIKATFFVCGRSIKTADNILKTIVDEGHAIGNHTYSHNYAYIYKSKENFFQDFYKNEELIHQLTGLRPKILRLPGGSNNKSSKLYGSKNIMHEIIDELDKKGYLYFDWNVSSKDANGQDYSVEEIVNITLSQTKQKEKAIILFHDTSSKVKTLKALPLIITGLQEQGFQFGILSENSYRVTFPLPKAKPIPIKADQKKLPQYLLRKLERIEQLHKNGSR